MSEEASGAMSGAASGAAIGTQIMPGWGTAIGAVIGGIGGFLGGSKAKKRRQEMERKIREIGEKIATSARGRLSAMDNLTDQQKKLAEDQLDQMLEYYGELKLSYMGMAERNQAEADRQYGELIQRIEGDLQEELQIQGDVFAEYNQGLTDLYAETRDFIQADMAHNNELKDEFKTQADQAIKDTWQASVEAKIDLQNLKDSGGRPESFDRIVAENAKAFGDIQTNIDRNDAARGRTDLTGKKLTAQFAEAMAKGNIAGQQAQIGQQQEQALRGEIANLGNTAMNQSYNRLQGLKTDDGAQLARLAQTMEGQRLDATLKEGLSGLSMVRDANDLEMRSTEIYNNASNQIKAMLDQGMLSIEEAKMMEEKVSQNLKMAADQANWQYKDTEAKAYENQLGSQIGMVQRDLSAANAANKTDWAGIGQNVASIYGGLQGAGGASKSGVNDNLIAKGNYNAEFENALSATPESSNNNGFMSGFSSLFGGKSKPSNIYTPSPTADGHFTGWDPSSGYQIDGGTTGGTGRVKHNKPFGRSKPTGGTTENTRANLLGTRTKSTNKYDPSINPDGRSAGLGPNSAYPTGQARNINSTAQPPSFDKSSVNKYIDKNGVVQRKRATGLILDDERQREADMRRAASSGLFGKLNATTLNPYYS